MLLQPFIFIFFFISKKNWNFNYFVQRRFPSKKMCFECKILDFRFCFFSFYVMGQREFRVGLFSYTSLLFSLTKLLVLVFIIQECKWINTVFFFLFLKDKLCDACLYWAFDIVPFVFQLWFQVKVRVFLSFVQILVFEYLLNFALFTLYLAPQWVWLLDFTNVLTLLCGWNWYLLVIPDGMMAFTFQWLICQTFHAFPIDIVKWFEEEALNVACCEMGRRDLELKLPQW